MRTNENDAWMTYKLPSPLKESFREGCDKRGINMSALQRTFLEKKVVEFAAEDAQREAT